ncbi:single-stranded DNA-specific exonuclease [Methanomethylovorans hollandica DSM 15978]|uniref:Single-stranded DNA-specific exonuclease n=1 Tax=Methanomethylovorans hollandica (strain DSM 15978 / NBRC 107637 / DMS1) TaxID=867904 RepID=L0KY30_METHD|nr:single-stranded DNA-specific exonuclease [Methanomethylovorans hollandica DSM 15978]
MVTHLTSESIALSRLKELAAKAADVISAHRHVRLISHNDADGLTSAGIMCRALMRKGMTFQTTITSRLAQDTIDTIKSSVSAEDLVIFCDMGSGQIELIRQIENDVIVIDHHMPVGESPAKVAVNPHYTGIDGAIYLSASGTTYLVAKEMDPDNVDLAGLAIAGAVGDKQLFGSANLHILEEATQAGVVSVKKGLKVGDGDIADVLEYTPEPYLDITGDIKKIHDFLDILGVKGRLSELSHGDLKKLTSSIALKLAKHASPEAVDAAIGDVYYLEKELVKNVYDFVAMLNTCGKLEKAGMALSMCMQDASVVEEIRQLTIEYQRSIVANIKQAEGMLQQGKNICYIIAKDMDNTGMISSTMVRYMHPEKPCIVTNEVEGIVKISGRGTRALIDKGLDLAYALREGALAVGGQGGGHNIASGASIPPGKVQEFIDIVDDIVGQQSGEESGDKK